MSTSYAPLRSYFIPPLNKSPRHENDDDARKTWLAACLSAEGKDDESIAEFRKVKHLEKVNSYALCLVATSYCQAQDFAKAKQLSSVGIEQDNCPVASQLTVRLSPSATLPRDNVPLGNLSTLWLSTLVKLSFRTYLI